MPTRYLKPGICDSDAIDKCSPLAEILFYRLLVNVDDFGRLDARPAVVRSRCFPLKDDMTNAKTQEMLSELHRNGLILIYEVGGASFVQVNKWDNVPRAQTSKYPAPSPEMRHPKEMLEIISEDDLEAMICESISSSGEFAGLKVRSHQRQVRKDQSYFDIVIDAECGQVGIELKRTRISKSAVDQVVKYKKISGIPFVLVGAGIGVGVDITECEENGITVATYDENFNARVISTFSVIQRDFTLRAVVPLTVTVTVTETKTVTETGTGNRNRNAPEKPKPPAAAKAASPLNASIWSSYSAAYFDKYGTEPVRNAKVNSQVAQLGQRLGEDAPHVAGWFLTHKNGWYAQKMHSVDCLLSDAEKLRTEWATGTQMTQARARAVDKSTGSGNAFLRLAEGVK